jgi:hypothetical protein
MRLPEFRKMPRWSAAVIATGCGLCPLAAHADLIVDVTGSPSAAPYYMIQTISAARNHVTATTSNFSYNDGEITGNNTGVGFQTMDTTYALNGATVHATASAVPGGFYSSRNTASISVTNANAADSYYALGGFGSMTTAQFFSADALASRAVFNWRVTGLESSVPSGSCVTDTTPRVFDLCSTARMDFAATSLSNPDFYDMVNAGGDIEPLTAFGPGEYSYSIAGMPLNEVITFGYWTSAFVQINPGQLTQGGNYDYFANYANTFDLIGIDLYDENDGLITDWSLRDMITGDTVFTQDGRIPSTSVPEPGMLALLSCGLLGIGLVRRRRRIS